jgi:hypothetical protein
MLIVVVPPDAPAQREPTRQKAKLCGKLHTWLRHNGVNK